MKVIIELDDMDDDGIKRASDYLAFVKATRAAMVKNDSVSTYMCSLGLPARAWGVLSSNGIHTAADLTSRTAHEVRRLDGMGNVTFKQVLDFMQVRKLSFKV